MADPRQNPENPETNGVEGQERPSDPATNGDEGRETGSDTGTEKKGPLTEPEAMALAALYGAVTAHQHHISERVFATTLSVIGFDVVVAGAILVDKLQLPLAGMVLASAVVILVNCAGLSYLNGRANAFGRREDELFAVRDEMLRNHTDLSKKFIDDRNFKGAPKVGEGKGTDVAGKAERSVIPRRWWFVATILAACLSTLAALWKPCLAGGLG